MHVEYETGLPNDTVVEKILNVGHPDSWGEKYDPLYPYISRMSRKQVETTVKDGLLSYAFDDSHFNSLRLSSSMVYTIIMVPVTEEKNSFIGDEIFTEEDFDEKYPNSTTYWFMDPAYEDGYYFKFKDSFEMNNAHTIEEVYAFYTKETIPYKELEKNPFKYKGTPITFTGEVLQIQEEDTDGTVFTLLTNRLDLLEEELLETYKNRWYIELFFKWLKQHVKINYLFSHSPKGIWNQLMISLITVGLLEIMRILKNPRRPHRDFTSSSVIIY